MPFLPDRGAWLDPTLINECHTHIPICRVLRLPTIHHSWPFLISGPVPILSVRPPILPHSHWRCVNLHVEYADPRRKHGNLFIVSLFCEYINVEYGRVPTISKVNQAEYVINFRVAASQEYVNTYSTCRFVGGLVGSTPFLANNKSRVRIPWGTLVARVVRGGQFG